MITISYGWGPDDDTEFTTPAEYSQMDQLFQDAAHLDITVLVSSGDSGAMILSTTQAQASFPATDPWVIACGGTTIGDISGTTFEEVVWNDTFGQNSGATGGGISVLFPTLPAYQNGFSIPTRVNTGTVGRGIPDIAGDASPNSGYAEFVGGTSVGPTGGTSAVAPLYAGLMAVINANLGSTAGFINPLLYSLASSAFKDTLGAPGPADNSSREAGSDNDSNDGDQAGGPDGGSRGAAIHPRLLAMMMAARYFGLELDPNEFRNAPGEAVPGAAGHVDWRVHRRAHREAKS